MAGGGGVVQLHSWGYQCTTALWDLQGMFHRDAGVVIWDELSLEHPGCYTGCFRPEWVHNALQRWPWPAHSVDGGVQTEAHSPRGILSCNETIPYQELVAADEFHKVW